MQIILWEVYFKVNKKTKLKEIPLAKLENNELDKIKELENSLGNKYYLIAYNKENEHRING